MFALLGAATLALSACGGDDDESADTTDGAGQESPAADGDDSTDDGAAASGETTTVTAVDYAYEDLPETIEAGTTIQLQNESSGEVHEILAFRLPEGEDRPIQQLLQLPEDERPQLEMVGVALAPPGSSSDEAPAPPLTLDEPGRYAFICGIPTDAPPDEVMQAVQDFIEGGGSGEPDYPETGPPHFEQGMFAEVTVTAAAG